MNPKIIEQTIAYKGHAIKIRDGKVFLPHFGTTYYNRTMHTEYLEVPRSKLSKELLKYLMENRFL